MEARALGRSGRYPAPIRPDAPGIAARNRVRGIHITRTTGIPKWYGDHLDLDHAITALLCLDRPGFAALDPADPTDACVGAICADPGCNGGDAATTMDT